MKPAETRLFAKSFVFRFTVIIRIVIPAGVIFLHVFQTEPVIIFQTPVFRGFKFSILIAPRMVALAMYPFILRRKIFVFLAEAAFITTILSFFKLKSFDININRGASQTIMQKMLVHKQKFVVASRQISGYF